MRITVLTVADCPNARPALELVAAVLDGRDAEVELVEVADEADAVRLGMYGSPTILVDGLDPFAPPGAVPSLSCRLYRGPDGAVSGVPAEAALRRALTGNATAPHSAGTSDCCAPRPDAPAVPDTTAVPAAPDAVGRGGRGRRAPAEGGLRAVHQHILRHFAATGSAPDARLVQPVAATAGRSAAEVLAELADGDFLTLDEAGDIRAAYPFSAVPTRHRVRLDDGVEVWSMCAVDALGIPAMLRRDAVISSTDPVSGAPVTVTATGGSLHWEPASAVVFLGERPGGGPAATVCCDALNFFTDAANAEAWASGHPEVPGRTLDRTDAEQLGRQVFGPLLAP
ncbi:alkylmercury lyase family protein [Kitasatospora sp. NPDC056651]|uniref:alkylmercury lyase family protein n=1 Tax=Kitasatospora sp. NPDC056651 TaxID=3345892 RepID=UPI0036B8C74A